MDDGDHRADDHRRPVARHDKRHVARAEAERARDEGEEQREGEPVDQEGESVDHTGPLLEPGGAAPPLQRLLAEAGREAQTARSATTAANERQKPSSDVSRRSRPFGRPSMTAQAPARLSRRRRSAFIAGENTAPVSPRRSSRSARSRPATRARRPDACSRRPGRTRRPGNNP